MVSASAKTVPANKTTTLPRVATTVRETFEFVRGVAGAGGDWPFFRLHFFGGTGQPVTVQANGSKTTGL